MYKISYSYSRYVSNESIIYIIVFLQWGVMEYVLLPQLCQCSVSCSY